MPKYIKNSKQFADSIGLKIPKHQMKRKKRMQPKSRPSILQDKNGYCYLCMQEGIWKKHRELHEHHVFNGSANKKISEAMGFKVYLCLEHHESGPDAVHTNIDSKRLIQKDCQRTFEMDHTREEWMALIGENYLEE